MKKQAKILSIAIITAISIIACDGKSNSSKFGYVGGSSSSSSETQQPKDNQQQPSNPLCKSTITCKEMQTCSQAMFYFKECGLSFLDNDGDGIPCENVCK